MDDSGDHQSLLQLNNSLNYTANMKLVVGGGQAVHVLMKWLYIPQSLCYIDKITCCARLSR